MRLSKHTLHIALTLIAITLYVVITYRVWYYAIYGV